MSRLDLVRAVAKRLDSRPGRKRENMAGRRFGRLVVVRDLPGTVNKKRRVECRCDCGNTTRAQLGHIKGGFTRSCGCLNAERASNRHIDPNGKLPNKEWW